MLLQTAQALFKRRLTSAIALPLVLLLLLSGVSIWQITRLLSAVQWVDHTDQVIDRANRVQRLLLDMETGVSGYRASCCRWQHPYIGKPVLFDTLVEIVKTLNLHCIVFNQKPQVGTA